MEVTEEEWVTTGQAAKMAARDVRTIRRRIDDGRLKARVSPYGHRQVALSSLLNAQPAKRRTGRRRAGERGGPVPPDCLEEWALTAGRWSGWQPAPTMRESELRAMLGQVDELRDHLDRLYETVADAIAALPMTSTDPEALAWLRSMPIPAEKPPGGVS